MTPTIAEANWNQAAAAIRDSRGILLVTHRNPDGDGIGSQIALFNTFADAGIPVYMHNRDGLPRLYQFLAGSGAVGSGDHCTVTNEVDLVISLDAGARSRLGMDDSFFIGKSMINIDHHPSNTCFGDINLVDAHVCATGVIAYTLIQKLGLPLSSQAAMAIYVALMTDTHSFHTSTVDSNTYRLAAELVEAGADPGLAAHKVYESQRPEGLELLRCCLQTLQLRNEGRSAWLHVDQEMYAATGSDVEDTEGLIDYGRAIAGVEISIFLRPEGTNIWKVSFRGKTSDVGALAASLGGGGHRYASGCTLHGDFNEVVLRLQGEIDRLLC